MAHRLRPVEPDFAESAPVRLVFTAEVRADPAAVYRALAEDVEGWPGWFTAVTSARPTRDGGGREVRLRGGARFQETIVSARPRERYAYRVDETNAPGVRAMLEEWRLSPAGSGTRVRWTMAVDGAAPVRLLMGFAKPAVGRAFRDAVRRLDRRLGSPAT
ncbi:SRPBCC family protein [Streptomyces spongiicola]|uniref:SRPBCC family protein n=1 Tax=Streptomyces spongiicola TaxID=1690221 RepID=UPI00157FAC1B|nr:SRPBCC family protein [Streptomyces spongiicola]